MWVHTVSGFPSPLVYEAYVSPTVDETRGKFTWGKPDVDVLREYVHKTCSNTNAVYTCTSVLNHQIVLMYSIRHSMLRECSLHLHNNASLPGFEKTRVFLKKPTGSGFFGLFRVLLGFFKNDEF